MCVHFSPGLLQVQDFPESNLFTADHMRKNRFSAELIASTWLELRGLLASLDQSSLDCKLGWSSTLRIASYAGAVLSEL
jgi:hypothetical protein